MKTTQIFLLAVTLLVTIQTVANTQTPIGAEYIEECSIVSDTTMSNTGADVSSPESIAIYDSTPRELFLINALGVAWTRKKGPAAHATADLTFDTKDHNTCPVGVPDGDVYAHASAYYYILPINNGAPIDHSTMMRFNVTVKGRVDATVDLLGRVFSSAQLIIERETSSGDFTTVFEKAEFGVIEPIDGCKNFQDECITQKEISYLGANEQFIIYLQSGAPIPMLRVEAYAGGRARCEIGCELISAYPWKYKSWGGSAKVEIDIDPLISIDPTWEYADQFELVISPGVVQGLYSYLYEAIAILQIMSGQTPEIPVSLISDVNGDQRLGLAEVINILQQNAQ